MLPATFARAILAPLAPDPSISRSERRHFSPPLIAARAPNARGSQLATRKSNAKQPAYIAGLSEILKTHTQREAALLLGVSDRTIRRWKNEGSTPKLERQERIQVTYKEEIKTRRESKKRRIPIKLTRMIGGSYFYGVKGQSNWNIAMLLKSAAENAPKGYPPLVRFIIRIPKGGTSPGGREFKQGGFYSTAAMTLEHAETDSDFLDIAEEFNTHGNIHEVVRMLPWQTEKTKARKAKRK